MMHRRKMVLVCEGDALEFLLKFNMDEMLDLQERCDTMVCYRSTPAQKALAVRCMKIMRKKVCLAVGDGANDVSMILQADVGVGIMGKEGAHAAMSADYIAIRFKHLQRLILVHGRWSLLRAAGTIFMNLYKCMAFPVAVYIFGFVSAADGTVQMDEVYFSFFSLLFTSLPPFMIGVFDQDVKSKYLLSQPQLYKDFRNTPSMSFYQLFYWLAVGTYHSTICYLSYHLISFEEVWLNGNLKSGGMAVVGNALAFSAIVIINIQMTIASQYITWYTFVGGLLGVVFFLAFMFGLGAVVSAEMYGVAHAICNTPNLWFVMLFCIVTAFLPTFLYSSYRAMFKPSVNHLFYEALARQEKRDS